MTAPPTALPVAAVLTFGGVNGAVVGTVEIVFVDVIAFALGNSAAVTADGRKPGGTRPAPVAPIDGNF
jgi:hypothetical protein